MAARLTKRTPVILQSETSECGLACLAMIAAFYGYKSDLTCLRERVRLSGTGMTLKHLINVSASLGLLSRAVKLDLLALKRLQVPCVLHWDLSHYVVLERVAGRRAYIIDPASGRRALTFAEVSEHFTGVGVEVSPGAEFRTQDTRRRLTLSALTGKWSRFAPAMAQLAFFAICLEAFAITVPQLTQWIIDEAIPTEDVDLLGALTFALLLLVLSHTAVSVIRALASVHLSSTANLHGAAHVFTHLLRLPIDYFERRSFGDITSRFGSVNTIQRTLTASFVDTVIDGLFALCALGMMMLYNIRLALLSLTALVFYIGLRTAFFKPLSNAQEQAIAAGAKQHSYFLETLRAVVPIKLFTKESERCGYWFNLAVASANDEVHGQKLGIAFRAGHDVTFGVERAAVLAIGAGLVIDNAFSLGMLIAFLAYREQFASRASKLVDKLTEFKMLRVQYHRLADIVLSEPEKQVNALLGLHEMVPSLELRDVWFCYGNYDPWILQGVSLRVDVGESLAIVGPSGAGKTTLAKLILGILKPTRGEIRIGGVSLNDLGVHRARAMIGAVMQDDELLAGTMADNIAFFESAADGEAIRECAKAAAIHDEIVRLPMGYNTLVGDMGAALSGGQRQRVLIARALYKRPKILIFDEATSHLDLERERQVNATLKVSRTTRIIIAHRPETIALATRVFSLDRVAREERQKQSLLANEFNS